MAKKIGIIVLLCFSLCVGGVSAFANEGHDETDTQTLIETQHPVFFKGSSQIQHTAFLMRIFLQRDK